MYLKVQEHEQGQEGLCFNEDSFYGITTNASSLSQFSNYNQREWKKEEEAPQEMPMIRIETEDGHVPAP